MPFTVKQNNSSSEIWLEGAMNIACAAELRTILVGALSAGLPLTICLGHLTDLDVCILQLLDATMREGKQLGLDCKLAGPLTVDVMASIADTGFEALPITPNVGVLREV